MLGFSVRVREWDMLYCHIGSVCESEADRTWAARLNESQERRMMEREG